MHKIIFGLIFTNLIILSTAFANDEEYSPMVSIKIENNNPFLNLAPKLFYEDGDHGATHALQTKYAIKLKDGFFQDGERWTVELKSALYTEDLTPPGKDLFPNNPQQFRELTNLNVNWDNVLSSDKSGKIHFVVGAGVLYINEKDERGWGAVGQQKRWHIYKHNELTPEITPIYDNQLGSTEEYTLMLTAAIGKTMALGNKEKIDLDEHDRAKIELGAELITVTNGSKAYLLLAIDKTILNITEQQNIGLILNNLANFHYNGTLELKTFAGIRYSLKSVNISTGYTRSFGKQNTDLLKYVNDDDIWQLEIEKKF